VTKALKSIVFHNYKTIVKYIYGSEKWSSPKEWVSHAETKVNGVLAW
jgi:hypothetical protein